MSYGIGYSQFLNKEVKAEIKVENKGEFLVFTGFAENLTASDFNLKYELMIFKIDENQNSSKTNQENLFYLQAHDKLTLSSTSLNFNEKGKIKVILLINDLDNKPLGKDILELDNTNEVIQEIERTKDKIIITQDEARPQDGFIINGLVLEKTITKNGRDFYRFYYSEYYNKQIVSPRNIEIEEAPGRGRGTRITLKVGNQIIMQFFAQPKKEFLQEMASIAINRTIAYLQQLKSSNNLKYY
jgi:hypothetical protein